MSRHIHVHLHKTSDAGTSEGAKKAAQTRKAHGGGGGEEFHWGPHATRQEAQRHAQGLSKQRGKPYDVHYGSGTGYTPGASNPSKEGWRVIPSMRAEHRK